jgi:S-adenosylmethionine hydrolase
LNPVITLTSDFGQKDPYLASLKGELHRLLEHPVIVDLSHEIEPFHIAQAAFIVQNSYAHFPEGSVHILFVDDTVSPENKPIIAKLKKHYFISADNGILSLISPKFKTDEVYEIDIQKVPNDSFSTRTIFTQAAAHLMRGGTPSLIGKKIEQINVRLPFTPSVNNDKKTITGKVIYIDNYENVITNISQKLFLEIGQGRAFTIQFRNNEIKQVVRSYAEVIRFEINKNKRMEGGKELALFNSLGLLELAIYKSNPKHTGGASSLFGLQYLDAVSVHFE